MKETANKSTPCKNLLLVAGDGRNVGKTTLCCRIIKQLSVLGNVTALKVSPHFHYYNEQQLVEENADFILLKETEINHKDSSLFLQAGAKNVYFLMVKQENIERGFQAVLPHLNTDFIVAESGGLHEILQPVSFLFVHKTNTEISKEHYLKYNPQCISNDGQTFSPGSINFLNHKLKLNSDE